MDSIAPRVPELLSSISFLAMEDHTFPSFIFQMTQPTTPNDQPVSFNLEEFLGDVPTSSPHSLANRSHSFREQSSGHQLFLLSSGLRPRAQSDNIVFRFQTSLHSDGYDCDTFAVADDDLPSSSLPPMAAHPVHDHWNVSYQGNDSGQPTVSPLSPSLPSPDPGRRSALWSIRDDSNPLGRPALSLSTELLSPRCAGPASDASSIRSVSPSLLPPGPGQNNARWSIRHECNASGQTSLIPFSPNPGLLSPWSAGPGSDASPMGSLSSSSSRSRLFSPSLIPPSPEFVSLSYTGGSPDPPNLDLQSDLHSQSSPEEEPASRGRLVRRGERQKSRHLSSIGSTARILFEDLTLEDGSSAERSHYNDPTSPFHPTSTTQNFNSLLEFSWFGPIEGPYGHTHSSATGSPSFSSNLEGSFLNLPEGHETRSSDAGRSRSHSKAPGDTDVFRRDRGDKLATRGHRRREASPYPVAGPSTNRAEGSNPTEWTSGGDSIYDFSNHFPQSFDPQARFATNPSSGVAADGPSSSSFLWDAGQSSQEEGGHDSAYRPSVATAATRRASNRRRKDPSKPGAHICQYCGDDFTALHNLNCTSRTVTTFIVLIFRVSD
ncbi:hypothetical protein B0H12DRAFT_701255 [Mycena haematopus]|nr:hypothetical protein B0H12DRAFT_701255 [Mycena haematopus]